MLQIYFCQFVHLEMSDWLMVQVVPKDVLKCASTISGVQSVTMDGILMLQTLFAISVVIQDSVC